MVKRGYGEPFPIELREQVTFGGTDRKAGLDPVVKDRSCFSKGVRQIASYRGCFVFARSETDHYQGYKKSATGFHRGPAN